MEVGRESARTRVIAGRAREYRAGLELLPPAVRLRETVWSGDGRAAVDGDSVVRVVTPWVPTRLLRGAVLCDVPSRYHPSHVRLSADLVLRGRDVVARVWMDGQESVRCMGTASAEDRLAAFLDDLEMHVRDLARRSSPVPIRRS